VGASAFLPVVAAVSIGSQTVGTPLTAGKADQCIQYPRSLQYHVAHATEVLFFKILTENIRVFVPFRQYRNSVTVDTGLLRVTY